jgi:hypothetical protein
MVTERANVDDESLISDTSPSLYEVLGLNATATVKDVRLDLNWINRRSLAPCLLYAPHATRHPPDT